MAVKKNSYASYLVIGLIIIGVATFGGWLVTGGLDWYETLLKPSWTPPSQIFTWAWIVSYILVGYSATIVWSAFKRDTRFMAIMSLYGTSAFFYLVYTYFFFRAQYLGSGILVAILLEINVIVISVLVFPKSKRAAFALFPVAAWLAFASYLTYEVWELNTIL